MKKITLIFGLLGILAISAYFMAAHKLGAPGFPTPAKGDTTVDAKNQESVLDLRPAIIAKLEETIKKSSGGLYNLSIHEVEPDIFNSTVVLKKIVITPDSSVLAILKKEHNAPQRVFRISFDSLRIDGLGIKDLANKNDFD